ncbi:sialidase family protein [Pedobacter endophyticus]|uniref:exo-alpha-sialidase n=1 Tax=Pedobacter endophyticus TaxID=2789740 RepID=A0A7S9L149_9SPHI|nr:sialidase family protein [Pedobacter endophyticus]QPH40562.1 exo-alpha-sialidase [Pedobacter endophyticus]
MKHLNIVSRLTMLLAFLLFSLPLLAQQNISVTTTAPVVPIIKGETSNPLLRIMIYIPAGEKGIQLKKLKTKLNSQGISALEKIDVYFTNQEPLFSATNKIATINPKAADNDANVDLNIGPGLHYIWFSGKLNDDADLDSKVEFHVSEIEDIEKKTYKTNQKGSGYVKRLGVAVKQAGENGIHTFRIPGIATTDQGTLISVYDVRYKNSGDLPGNIDVGMSRSTDGGKSWEPMKVIMDMGAPNENNGVGDPAVLFDPVTKKIWVAALWSKGNRSIAGSKPGLSEDVTGQLVLVSSDDDGRTWSAPVSITPSVKDPEWNLFFNGPGSGIAMADGKLVFAAQYWDEHAMPHSTIVYSSDHGKNWKTEDGPKSNTTESQVIETLPGTLMLNMRDNRGGFRSVATTNNMGKTWTEHHTSYNTLPDPVCMASFIKANVMVKGKTKDVVFFGNDNTQSGRYNLTIKASLDLGEQWNKKNELLIDERKFYGYSALTKIDHKTIGFLYEGAGDLYFVRVPVSDIIK